MKRLLLLLVILPAEGYSSDIFSMTQEEFYSVEQNHRMYEKMQKSGSIDKARKMHVANCSKAAKNSSGNADCDCIAEEINKMDGKLLMFESILSLTSYKAKVAAKHEGDEDD